VKVVLYNMSPVQWSRCVLNCSLLLSSL